MKEPIKTENYSRFELLASALNEVEKHGKGPFTLSRVAGVEASEDDGNGHVLMTFTLPYSTSSNDKVAEYLTAAFNLADNMVILEQTRKEKNRHVVYISFIVSNVYEKEDGEND